MFCINLIFKSRLKVSDKLYNLYLLKFQEHLSFIDLPDIHQLVNQIKNTFRISEHDTIRPLPISIAICHH